MGALRAGKTVFVEKPLGMTEQELADIVATQRESQGVLTVGFNRRFAPHVVKMSAALARRSTPVNVLLRVNAGALPPTHWIQRPEVGGGRIVGEVCHFVDLAACLVGMPPHRVFAKGSGSDGPPLLADDLSVLLSFGDGSVATIVYTSAGDTVFPKERIEVFCEGRVMVSDDYRTLTLTQGGRTHTSSAKQPDKGHSSEVRAFLDLVSGRPSSAVPFADCVSSMAATFKILESLTSGVEVDVPRVHSAL
jgi:predicted dehydrogenase